MPAGFPQGDRWRGRDELRRELHDQFSDLFTPGTVDVKSIESVPEGSLVSVRHSVEARASGMDLWWDAWYVWTVEDELITPQPRLPRPEGGHASGGSRGLTQVSP